MFCRTTIFARKKFVMSNKSLPINESCQYVTTPQGQFEFTTSGNETLPAYLCIHGGMGGFDQSALLAKAALTPELPHRSISISRPGYLGSALNCGKAPPQQADLFAYLLDQQKIDQATVVAISAGGPSALEFAVRHQDRCKALILISCCTKTLPVKRTIYMRLAFLKLMAQSKWLSSKLEARVRKDPLSLARRSISDRNLLRRTVNDSESWALMQALQQSTMHNIANRIAGTVNDTRFCSKQRGTDISAIRCPTLIVHGSKDSVVPVDHATAAQQSIYGSELLLLENAEHVALFTHLHEIRQKVFEFMNNIQPTASLMDEL